MCIDLRINCRSSTCSRSTIKIVFIAYLSNYGLFRHFPVVIEFEENWWKLENIYIIWRLFLAKIQLVLISTLFKNSNNSVKSCVGWKLFWNERKKKIVFSEMWWKFRKMKWDFCLTENKRKINNRVKNDLNMRWKFFWTFLISMSQKYM